MLDLAGIMLSSMIMLLVIIRAVQLDGTQPWFQTTVRKKGQTAPEAGMKRPSGGWRDRRQSDGP